MFDITQGVAQGVAQGLRAQRFVLAALTLLLAVASACSSGTAVEEVTTESLPSDMPPRDQLAMAFDLWAKNGPDDYDLIVERVCEPCRPSKWRHTVIDGNVAMYQSLTTTPGSGEGPQTMRDLFTSLRGMLMNQDLPPGLEMDFNAATGALRSWTLPSEERGARGLIVTLEDPSDVPMNEHGAAVAEAACPNVAWQSVRGSAFSLLIPNDLAEVEVEGVDSEVAVFESAAMKVSWDYGPYSNRLGSFASDFTRTNVSYSGIGGHWVSVEPGGREYDGRRIVAIHFTRIREQYDQWNGLTVFVQFDDPALQPVAECLISSLEWN